MWEEQGGKGGKDQGRKKDFAGGSQAGLCVNTTVVNTCFLITVRAHLCKQALIRTQAPAAPGAAFAAAGAGCCSLLCLPPAKQRHEVRRLCGYPHFCRSKIAMSLSPGGLPLSRARASLPSEVRAITSSHFARLASCRCQKPSKSPLPPLFVLGSGVLQRSKALHPPY